MSKIEKPELEIHYFEEDIITTSTDHDNGYVDSGTLASALKEIKDTFF